MLDDFRNTIAVTASISTILQFLSGTLVCMKIVQNKCAGDVSAFPFVSGCLSTSLWLRYGFFIEDRSLVLVNTIGASLFLGYVATFLIYSIKKTTVIRQCIACLVTLAVTLFYVESGEFNEAKKTLGLVCCIVTILFFAAPFATLFHVIQVKSTESLPFPIISSNFIVSLQWLLYGIILNDSFIKIPNFLGCILSGFQLTLFCFYPKNAKTLTNEFI